jgi:hypothetical protein
LSSPLFVWKKRRTKRPISGPQVLPPASPLTATQNARPEYSRRTRLWTVFAGPPQNRTWLSQWIPTSHKSFWGSD